MSSHIDLYLENFIGKDILIVFFDDSFDYGTLLHNSHKYSKCPYMLRCFNCDYLFFKSHVKEVIL